MTDLESSRISATLTEKYEKHHDVIFSVGRVEF